MYSSVNHSGFAVRKNLNRNQRNKSFLVPRENSGFLEKKNNSELVYLKRNTLIKRMSIKQRTSKNIFNQKLKKLAKQSKIFNMNYKNFKQVEKRARKCSEKKLIKMDLGNKSESVMFKIDRKIQDLKNFQQIQRKQKNKLYFGKIKKFCRFLRLSKLSKKDLEKFPQKAYSSPLSKKFIECCKLGLKAELEELLNRRNRFLVYEYDYFNMTALHWASKRNHLEIMKILLKKKSNVDAEDIWGRTPLFYAIKNRNEKATLVLLKYNSSPWSNKSENFLKISDNSKIQYYIRQFRFIDMLKVFLKKKDRENFLEKSIKKFVKNN